MARSAGREVAAAKSAAGRPGHPRAADSSAPPLSNRAVGRLLWASAPAMSPDLIRWVLSEPGEPLRGSVLARMEEQLGQPLGHVRIHRDARAARSTRAANPAPNAVGNHVVFGPGQYAPDSDCGQRVLSHELIHALQASGRASLGLLPPRSRAERVAVRGPAPTGSMASGGPGGVARIVEKDLTQLNDAELQAEYELAQKWIADHNSGPDYDAEVACSQEIEQAVSSRMAAAASSPSPAAAAPPAEASTPGQEVQTSGTEDVGAPVQSTAEPGASTLASGEPAAAAPLASVNPSAPVAPEDMVSYVVNQRAFGANRRERSTSLARRWAPGTPPTAWSRSWTTAGSRSRSSWASTAARGTPTRRSRRWRPWRPASGTHGSPGGKLIGAVDQKTCPGCSEAIRAFAQRHGLGVVEVWSPALPSIPRPNVPVSQKTAARTAYSSLKGAKPAEPELLWGETLNPAAEPAAVAGGAQLTPGPSSAEPGGQARCSGRAHHVG